MLAISITAILVIFIVGMILSYRFGYHDATRAILRGSGTVELKKKDDGHFDRVIDGGSIQ